jgi:hypothetical protein
MSVRTNGAEWKRFYADPTFWPDGAYHEDEEITINGEAADWGVDLTAVADDAVMTVSHGVVFLGEDDSGPSLETHFKRWRRAQTTVCIACEVHRDKVDAVKSAIRAAGGRVI